MDQVGRKDDGGKPWAGTVLAGFRDAIGVVPFSLQPMSFGEFAESTVRDIEVCRDALSVYLDTSLSVTDRLVGSAAILRNCNLAVRAAVDVGTYGARKYAPDNWLHVDDGVARYYEAGGRHVLDMLCGVSLDDPSKGGSGLPNLSHWAWNVFAGATLASKAGA